MKIYSILATHKETKEQYHEEVAATDVFGAIKLFAMYMNDKRQWSLDRIDTLSLDLLEE